MLCMTLSFINIITITLMWIVAVKLLWQKKCYQQFCIDSPKNIRQQREIQFFDRQNLRKNKLLFLSDRSHKGTQVIQIIKRKNTATTFFAFVCVGVNAESHHHWLRLRLSSWTSNVLYAFYSF